MSEQFEKTMTMWLQSLRSGQEVRSNWEPSHDWNCKNCGGPNINQVKCRYCGAVKE